MSSKQEASTRATVFNLPNQLTILRLILAVIMFCVIPWGTRAAYWTASLLFILAAGTDWLDGYYARKYNLITTLGRVLDPFADKVIVCGTFIFLAAVPELTQIPFGLRPWMVVVIVGRELLVTALRSFLEQRGADFSAKTSGKLKMALQCVAAVVALVYLALAGDDAVWFVGLRWLLVASIWAAVALTVYSGLIYVRAAVRRLSRP